MINFGFLGTPYTPRGVSLVLEKIWSKIKQCGTVYCMAKVLSIQNWRRHLFHQNFITNSLLLSNPLLFASGPEDCNLTSFLKFWQICRNIRQDTMDKLSNHRL